MSLAAVDVFGTRVAADEVLALAGGGDAMERLRADGRWIFAQLSEITYFAGEHAGKRYRTIDLVDVGDEARLRFAPAPAGSVEDPAELVVAWMGYEERAQALLHAGVLDLGAAEQSRALHAALGFGHPSLAAFDERFAREVPARFAAILRVLAEDADEKRRAAAAFLLAYGGDAQAVADAMLASVLDPSGLVRNNAMRVLVMLPGRATTPVRIDIEPLVAALAFPLTTDRNKAAFALLAALVDDVGARATVKARGGEWLARMAALTQPNNRDPARELLALVG